MKNTLKLLILLYFSSIGLVHATTAGYYASAKVFSAQHKAKDMESSARPGIGSFIAGDNTDQSVGGSLAVGYYLAPHWRIEGEYTLPKHDEFTSGSSAFPSSFNHHKIKSQRVMANLYRDFPFHQQYSAYVVAALGLSKMQSSGWQGNINRQYGSHSDNNLSYAFGAGLSYIPRPDLALDFGYRYVDLGQTESGWNHFSNARGLQDEQMKARLVSNEITLGLRYQF